MKLTNFSMSQ